MPHLEKGTYRETVVKCAGFMQNKQALLHDLKIT
jgi:hypothetical protein